MKKLICIVGLSLPVLAGQAIAAPQPAWNWTGFYAGAHIGAGLGQSDFDNGSGPVISGNHVRSATVRGGLQAGYNWQASASAWVLGTEAELSILGADGSNTCFATSGDVASANCRVRQRAMGSLTGRLGYAAGPGARTLLYTKAGGAWLNEGIDLSTDYGATATHSDRFGWVVGAGIEHAIAPAWSVKLEYDYADFGHVRVATPASASLAYPDPAATVQSIPAGQASVGQTVQTVKLGVNWKLGADPGARWADMQANPFGLPVKASRPSGYEVELGGRVWYSAGRFQKDLGSVRNPVQQDPVASRLTYDSEAVSGELFGRVDAPSNIVLKGFVGGGGLTRGRMIDEDWGIKDNDAPYSNTLSDPVVGSIGYATVDLGYDLLRDRGGKLAAFVGYNYLRDDQTAKGCIQRANPSGMCPAVISNSVPGVSEIGEWQSLRLGINGVMMLTDRLQLTADAAYLPYAHFHGLDNHMQRPEDSQLSPERGTGQGVQLEAVLAYKVTPAFSVGIGGRYWALWATGPDAHSDAFSEGAPYTALPVRTEHVGGFLQASYAFDSAR